MTERRTRFDMAADILRCCNTSKTITEIITECRLNPSTAIRMTGLLLDKKLLEKEGERYKGRYLTTTIGFEFVASVKKLREVCPLE